MVKKLYEGTSEGFKSLTDGYMEYALETIKNRAIPDLRDGLKPVVRRTIYAMHEHNYYKLTPSLKVVGDISHYHPHGDSSVYEAYCRLTDRAESLNVPLLIGNGAFSKVYLEDKPADKRYTSVMLAPIAREFVNESRGIEMVLDEKGEGLEPAVLPVTFPFILVGGSMGMAVSMATNIPSYNFWDVLRLTEKALYKESFTEEDIIVPDFPTGGYIVNNREEFANIMFTGKGKLKLRADITINGKEINIVEVPYGRLVGGMLKKLKKAEIPGVSSVFESTDFKSEDTGNKITITCTAKSKVEEVLMSLYRLGIAQSTFSSNITAIMNEEPVIGGVFTVIRRWVEWRKSVIRKVQEETLKDLYKVRSELDYFIRLVTDVPKRDKFIDLMVNHSMSESKGYLKELFTDIIDSEIEFIVSRRLSQFNNGGKYAERLKVVESNIEECLDLLKNPEKQIQKDIDRLRIENKGKYLRKTKITEKDYKFSKIEYSDIEDNSPCVYKWTEKGIVKLQEGHYGISETDNVISSQANGVLVGFDSLGRCIRVYGSDLSFGRACSFAEYFGVTGAEGYSVPYLVSEDSEQVMLVYSDGYCSFFNPEEVKSGARKALLIKQGVPEEVKDKLTHIIPLSQMKEYMVLSQGNKKCVIPVENIRVKGRLFRTQLVDTDTKFDEIVFMSKEELYDTFENPVEYMQMLKEVEEVQ